MRDEIERDERVGVTDKQMCVVDVCCNQNGEQRIVHNLSSCKFNFQRRLYFETTELPQMLIAAADDGDGDDTGLTGIQLNYACDTLDWILVIGCSVHCTEAMSACLRVEFSNFIQRNFHFNDIRNETKGRRTFVPDKRFQKLLRNTSMRLIVELLGSWRC